MAAPMQGLPNAQKILGWINVKNYGADPTGTNDSAAAINGALSAAAAVGQAVYLPPGTYLVSSPVTPGDGAAIYGAGRDLTTVKASTTFSGNAVILAANDVSNLAIQELTVDANSQSTDGIQCPYSASGATDVTVRSVQVTNTGGTNQTGIDLGTVSTRARIEECQLSGCTGPGIQLGEPTDAAILACLFSGNLSNPSNAAGNIGDINIIYNWNRVTISNCHFYESGQALDYTNFVLAAMSGVGPGNNARSLSISDCVGDNSGNIGFYVTANQTGGGTVSDTTINGCIARNCGETSNSAAASGFYILAEQGTVQNTSLSGCTAYHCRGYGIEIVADHFSVSSCSAYDTPNPGFYLSGSAFAVSGCYSTNSAGGFGFEINTCTDGTLSGCTASGNDWGGFLLKDCQRVGIYGCTANGNGVGSTTGAATDENSGIVLDATCVHCSVVGNICMNQSRVSGSSNVRAGIRLYGATYTLVECNLCSDDQSTKTQDYGVYEDNGGDHNTIRNNDLRGNITGALSAVGANTITSNNRGLTPAGVQTAPTIPSASTAIQNPFGYDCMVLVTGGTGINVALGAGSSSAVTSTGIGSGVPFVVRGGQYVSLGAYSAAPSSWYWIGI